MAFREFTPLQYLQLDVTSGYGLDKQTFDNRLAWFDQNQHHLHKLVTTAKDPAHYYAAVTALEACARGEAVGHLVSWDATASGLQILSAASCDPKAAALCNVIDTGNRENAYQTIHRELQARVGDHAQLDPDDVKAAIMTSFYGSKAVPKQIFGEELLPAYNQTLEDMAEGPWGLNLAFLDMWDSNALEYGWVLPDGFTVHVTVKKTLYENISFMGQTHSLKREVNEPVEEGRSIGANVVHSIDAMIVREISRRCNYNPTQVSQLRLALNHGRGTSSQRAKDQELIRLLDLAQATGFLSARVIDYIDRDNVGLVDRAQITDLLDSLPKKPFPVLTNHQWWL